MKKMTSKIKKLGSTQFGFFFILIILSLFIFFIVPEIFSSKLSSPIKDLSEKNDIKPVVKDVLLASPIDKVAYDKKMQEIANNPPPPIVYENIKTVKKDKNGNPVTKITKVPKSPQPVPNYIWPVKQPYPNSGAILPFYRIVAYYGNLYSKKMGVLGQYDENIMLEKLNSEVKRWNEADPETPVIPALHYIVVVAQGAPGKDGKYRARMPDTEIDKVLRMAEKVNGIVFLDVQVALSNVQTEIPLLEKYLKMPRVHLGIDPEFAMKNGTKPGKVIGTLDASDINFAAEYLDNLVKKNNLPPKILIVHRFTQKMVTNYKNIKPSSDVQIIMNMDGWGDKAKKIGTYQQFIYKEPVQFTGFKLFYKNDVLTPGTTIFSPKELLNLNPKPIYIQYQ